MIGAYLYAAIIITAILLHPFWRSEVSFIVLFLFHCGIIERQRYCSVARGASHLNVSYYHLQPLGSSVISVQETVHVTSLVLDLRLLNPINCVYHPILAA